MPVNSPHLLSFCVTIALSELWWYLGLSQALLREKGSLKEVFISLVELVPVVYFSARAMVATIVFLVSISSPPRNDEFDSRFMIVGLSHFFQGFFLVPDKRVGYLL